MDCRNGAPRGVVVGLGASSTPVYETLRKALGKYAFLVVPAVVQKMQLRLKLDPFFLNIAYVRSMNLPPPQLGRGRIRLGPITRVVPRARS